MFKFFYFEKYVLQIASLIASRACVAICVIVISAKCNQKY